MPLTLGTPAWLALLILVIPVVALGRRGTVWLAAGVALLAVAAAEPAWRGTRAARVAVWADVSASTRTAGWRDGAAVRAFADEVGADVVDRPDAPDADALVLLTDGRHAGRPGRAAYVVADPILDDPGDRRAGRLAREGREVVSDISGRRREAGPVAVAVPGGDAWPENDALMIPATTDQGAERWHVGPDPPPGFAAIGSLPTDVGGYGGVGVLSVAGPVPDAAAEAVAEWVGGLGGTLIVSGVEGRGGLGDVSPLSFVPPGRPGRWALLADASGSMANDGRADLARAAVRAAAAALPAGATYDLAAFADELRWGPRDVAAGGVVPFDPGPPGGETRLGEALEKVAADPKFDGGDVLVVTDAEADVAGVDLPDLTLHVLHLGDRVDPSLAALVDATGGTLLREPDPARWRSAAASLVRGDTASKPVDRSATLATDPPVTVSRWRPAWAKAEAVAVVDGRQEGPSLATWRVGLGRVADVAADVPPEFIATLADDLAASPPAAEVTWRDGEALAVTVAADAERVELVRDGVTIPAARVGPETWRASIDGGREPAVAVVAVDGEATDRRATAGRYDAEFEAVGNDKPALLALAGGDRSRVTAWPATPSIPRVPKEYDLQATCFTVAALLTGFGLVRRVRG